MLPALIYWHNQIFFQEKDNFNQENNVTQIPKLSYSESYLFIFLKFVFHAYYGLNFTPKKGYCGRKGTLNLTYNTLDISTLPLNQKFFLLPNDDYSGTVSLLHCVVIVY